MMEEECIFHFKFNCSSSDELSQSLPKVDGQHARIDSVITASEAYGDHLSVELKKELSKNPKYTFMYHRRCMSRYATPKAYKGKKSSESSASPSPCKRVRRSNVETIRYKTDCFFCGEKCQLKDECQKNPSWWKSNKGFLFRSLTPKASEKSQCPVKTVEETFLDQCKSRNDKWGDEIRIRLSCCGDLVAADARYHVACRTRFMNGKQPPGSEKDPGTSHPESHSDDAFDALVKEIREKKEAMYNSVEVHEMYEGLGGYQLSRYELVDALQAHFKRDLVAIHVNGFAKVLMFRESAMMVLKLVKDEQAEESEDLTPMMKKVSKQVKKDISEMSFDDMSYNKHINTEKLDEYSSETVKRFLNVLSPGLGDSLKGYMICNIITECLSGHHTPLQIAIGIYLRGKKKYIKQLYPFGITCSYDEMRRFRKSSAIAAYLQSVSSENVLSLSKLRQMVIDNFDCAVTHALAMITIGPPVEEEIHYDAKIPRITKTEMSKPVRSHGYDEDDMCIVPYTGQTNPDPPQMPVADLPEELLDRQKACSRLAEDLDFEFLTAITTMENVPEYNGFMTQKCRERGIAIHPKSVVTYQPLINAKPSDPSTVLTSMLIAKQLAESQGQKYVVMTGDLQIYRVAVQITWDDPHKFSSYFLRLGGMHLLMSFIGSIGTLLEDSGLEDIIDEAFSGTKKLISGKKFPECIRAFRMVAEEVLRPIFHLPDNLRPESMSQLLKHLELLSSQSRTTKLWCDVLIKGVLITMMYVRAEREAEITLHMKCVKEMEKFFFASGHVNYARYALYYRCTLEMMPEDLQRHFLNGEHTMHHVAGIFNGEWSDMAIETTAMKDKAADDTIVGDTNKADTVDIYAYSVHDCLSIDRDLQRITNSEETKVQMTHKDESASTISSDAMKRQKIREKLAISIDPLDVVQHPVGSLVNIVTGEVMQHCAINVDDSLEIGAKQCQSFEDAWPESFKTPISKEVITMTRGRRAVVVDGIRIIDTGIFYARAMGLHASGRTDIDIVSMLATELAPVATSMFDDKGNFRTSTKADLKNALKIETPTRISLTGDLCGYFLDGCAVLWAVVWPSKGMPKVQDFINAFREHIISRYLKYGDVYLVFDRYKVGSTKEMARWQREKGASRVFRLQATSRLPQQTLMLSVTANKVQLINLLISDLKENPIEMENTLVVTGPDPIPFQCTAGTLSDRPDMLNTQEEADTIVVCQVHSEQDGRTAVVVADDTDVFLLLVHFVHARSINCKVLMDSPSRGRHVLDINATARLNLSIVPGLLAAHALTGCDTVASFYGIGKGKALKVLKSGNYKLSLIGDTGLPMAQYGKLIEEASRFLLACYNLLEAPNLTAARKLAWRAKIAKRISEPPKLCTLPPTSESFEQNALRAHLQVATWKEALDPNPTLLDPKLHGWSCLDTMLSPTMVRDDTFLTPPELLAVIKCGCGKPGSSTEANPCRHRSCACYHANLSCSMFCVCLGEERCQNPNTVNKT